MLKINQKIGFTPRNMNIYTTTGNTGRNIVWQFITQDRVIDENLKR